MPSLTTTVLTSAVTLTSFVTVTAGQYVVPPPAVTTTSTEVYYAAPPPASSSTTPEYPAGTPDYPEECATCTAGQLLPPDVIGPIEGLAQCTQGIVFECLANSKCSPHDFGCVCEELKKLGIEGRVETVCSHEDFEQYKKFQWDVCHGGTPVPESTTVINVTSTVPPPVWNVTSTIIPYVNATSTITEHETQTVQVVTTDAVGQPTTIQSEVVVPVNPTGPAPPAYTGAAAALGAPEFGIMAGAMGLMGLVFAEL